MSWKSISFIIIAAQYLCALAIEQAVGFRYEIPVIGLLAAGGSLAIFGLGSVAMARTIWLARRGEPQPIKTLWAERGRAADVPILVAMITAQLAVLGWLKVTMPIAVGFWADPLLANVDAAIFGSDPWKLLPRALGPFMDMTYVTWGFASVLTLTYLAVAPDGSTRSKAIVAYFLFMAGSALGQYLLPSAGPIFYQTVGHGDRFAAMPIHPWINATAGYLWQNHLAQGGNVGAGISAMPSVHVGGAAWIALTVSALAPRVRLLGWAYFAVILTGSVFLGWHYAVDGIAGLFVALAAWVVAPALLRGGERFGSDRAVRVG